MHSSIDRQALQLLAVGAGIEDEVVRPHLVRVRSVQAGAAVCSRRAAAAVLRGTCSPCRRHSRWARSALIDMPAARQEDLDATIAVARILCGELAHRPRSPARRAGPRRDS